MVSYQRLTTPTPAARRPLPGTRYPYPSPVFRFPCSFFVRRTDYLTSSDVRDRLQKNLGERYDVERELGRGGMATVYLARDLRHDRLVALKVLSPEIALALGGDRFLREIRIAARLSHPHILTVHDSGEADGLLYYVMPYVEGESLRERLEREGTLPADDVINIARDVADGLGYAHASGIVHRDIKPENILLSRGHAMVADFGIASAVDAGRDEHLTATGISLGTPAYMSPEQALAETVDARSDVWALGCVIYEMLTGSPPFGREPRQVITRILTSAPTPVRELRPDVPGSLERVIDGALARRIDERTPSGAEIVTALDARNAATVESPARRSRPSKSQLVIGGAIAAVLIIIALVAEQKRDADPSGRPLASASTAGKDKSAGLSSDSVARQLYLRGQTQQARRTNTGAAEAIALFSRAIERDSSFALAWAGLSRSAQYAASRGFSIPGRSTDSLITLAFNASDRAVELDSTNVEIWNVRARAATAVDPTDRNAALSAIGRALTLDSTSSAAWYSLGLIREELLDAKGAEAAWLRAVKLNPKNVEALSFLGLHYLWAGQYQKGVPWADSAVALDPTYILARTTAGLLAVELGRPDDAEHQNEAYFRLTSGRERVDGLAVQVLVALARGDSSAARNYAAQAAKFSNIEKPTKHDAAYIGAAFAAIGDTARAVRWLAAYQPRGDLHYQLHLKRDPGLSWVKGPRGRGLLTPDPPTPTSAQKDSSTSRDRAQPGPADRR